ncbi:hypothetical protein ACFXEL_32385 [Streptomyces sp. NPDC059382]
MSITERTVRSPVLVVDGTGMLAGVVGALPQEGLTTGRADALRLPAGDR